MNTCHQDCNKCLKETGKEYFKLWEQKYSHFIKQFAKIASRNFRKEENIKRDRTDKMYLKNLKNVVKRLKK